MSDAGDSQSAAGRGSPYRSRRSPHWVKIKNPNAPAVDARRRKIWGARGVGMREVVIVAIAGALSGIAVAALLVHFLP